MNRPAGLTDHIGPDGRPPSRRPRALPLADRLLERVASDGWPEVVDLPTGLGKTAIIDIAVFASALGVEQARRRIFFVADRRLVADPRTSTPPT